MPGRQVQGPGRRGKVVDAVGHGARFYVYRIDMEILGASVRKTLRSHQRQNAAAAAGVQQALRPGNVHPGAKQHRIRADFHRAAVILH